MGNAVNPKCYFNGDIYSAKWLIDSVKESRLLPKDDYFSYKNEEKKSRKITFGKNNVKYTITEALKVFTIALRNREKNKAASYWVEVERTGIMPNRSADSMRNFFKTALKKGLENFMKQALSQNTWYCHAFTRIPKVELITPMR